MATTATMRTAKFLPMSGGKVRKIMVADSQTIAKNDFVILASGKVTIAAAAGATASDVYGVCMDNIANSGTASATYANVLVIDQTSRFIGNYADGTTNTAVAGTRATTAALPGLRMRLQRLAGKWCLTPQTAASDAGGVAICTAIANEDAVGTAGGRLIFKISDTIFE